jgi:hypothetical protein
MRDLISIYQKLLQVLYPPKGNGTNQLLRSVILYRYIPVLTGQRLGSMGSIGDLPVACYRPLYRCKLLQLAGLIANSIVTT